MGESAVDDVPCDADASVHQGASEAEKSARVDFIPLVKEADAEVRRMEGDG